MSRSGHKRTDSALSVVDGVNKPHSIKESAVSGIRSGKPGTLQLDDYLEGIRNNDRSLLSRAITLIESSLSQHQKMANELVVKCLPLSGNSIRIGITGVPGVGKSTFIESFGDHLISRGHKVAVLAVDPSSSRSKGSILGDKTRMELLSRNKNAFIRPSPSSGSLGGVTRKTRESIIICEAAGYDIILVETVGVGQSETAVRSMVDFFLLLMLAGAGDELQGIKRGIMEMADAIVINKADGDNLQRVNLAMGELRNAQHYFHPSDSGWVPVVSSCSAINNTGIEEVWGLVEQFIDYVKSNSYFQMNRTRQSLQLMYQAIDIALVDHFHHDPAIRNMLAQMEQEVHAGNISAHSAASKLIEAYFAKFK